MPGAYSLPSRSVSVEIGALGKNRVRDGARDDELRTAFAEPSAHCDDIALSASIRALLNPSAAMLACEIRTGTRLLFDRRGFDPDELLLVLERACLVLAYQLQRFFNLGMPGNRSETRTNAFRRDGKPPARCKSAAPQSDKGP
jgi:hypothetical protein